MVFSIISVFFVPGKPIICRHAFIPSRHACFSSPGACWISPIWNLLDTRWPIILLSASRHFRRSDEPYPAYPVPRHIDYRRDTVRENFRTGGVDVPYLTGPEKPVDGLYNIWRLHIFHLSMRAHVSSSSRDEFRERTDDCTGGQHD